MTSTLKNKNALETPYLLLLVRFHA